MTQFNLGYQIEAKDATRSTLASALSGVTKFARLASKPITIPLKIARGGLGLLRDFNLGLRPLVAGLDNIIERGGRLSLVSKSFQSLTGKGAADADKLARSLVRAASGTISLIKAQETANRALGSGLDFKQLLTTMEFISKKAITTGKNASQAVDTVITGLSRGSPLFLDDFGILVNQIPGVAREFDRIKGSGAFDSLSPAARKAEVIRQAVAEMNQQMSKIGLTGKETTFIFQGIKNSLGDSVDKLVAAVAASKSLRDSLKSTRDVIGGITKFVEGGGSILEVLTGKKGGKSGGLFGLLKAGVLDLAESIGRAIAAGLLKAAIRVGSLFQNIKLFGGALDQLASVRDTIREKVSALFSGLFGKKDDAAKKSDATKPGIEVRLSPRIPLRSSSASRSDGIGPGGFLSDGASAVARGLPGRLARSAATTLGSRGVAAGAGLAARGLSKVIAENAATEIRTARSAKLAGQFAAAGPVGAPALQKGVLASSKFIAKRAVPVATIGDFAFTMFKFIREIKGLFGALRDVKKAQKLQKDAEQRLLETQQQKELRGGVGLGLGFGIGAGRASSSLLGPFGTLALGAGDTVKSFTQLDEAIDKLLSGGSSGALGGRRLKREKANFLEDFPAPRQVSKFQITPIEVDSKNKRLSNRGFLDRKGEINLLFRRLRIIAARTRKDAGLIAERRIRELLKLGFKVSPEQRQEIRDRTFDRLLKERTERPRGRLRELQRELRDELERRGFRKLTTAQPEVQAAAQKKQVQIVEDIKGAVDRMEQLAINVISSLDGVAQALVGSERSIASAGGRRT